MGIKTLLRGESKNVEYKLTPLSRSINYTKTAVAFANGQGGCLVFGVEDQTLRVVGIAEDKVFTVMDSISDAIVNSCEPLIIPDITMRDVAGKTVIVAEIAPGLQRPYHIKSLGQEQGTFVSCGRHHASSRPAHYSGTDHRRQQSEFRPSAVPWTIRN